MAVVVRYEDAEHLFEMSSAQDQEPIEAFGASGADKALGDSVRSWRANGRPDDLEVLAQENGVEAAAELTVAIVDEEAEWCRPLGQRPGHLRACWVTQALFGFALSPRGGRAGCRAR